MKITFTLNGKKITLADCDPSRTLLEVIRGKPLHLTGTKAGCGKGECGACTVLFDGKPVTACLIPIAQVEGHSITTIEGITFDDKLHPVQEAFIEEGAVQCGFCIPGMVLSSVALLNENKNPSEPEIREALSGNLCRCTGYIKIFSAVKKAAHKLSTLYKKK